jgi:hypothetical protein
LNHAAANLFQSSHDRTISGTPDHCLGCWQRN